MIRGAGLLSDAAAPARADDADTNPFHFPSLRFIDYRSRVGRQEPLIRPPRNARHQSRFAMLDIRYRHASKLHGAFFRDAPVMECNQAGRKYMPFCYRSAK